MKEPLEPGFEETRLALENLHKELARKAEDLKKVETAALAFLFSVAFLEGEGAGDPGILPPFLREISQAGPEKAAGFLIAFCEQYGFHPPELFKLILKHLWPEKKLLVVDLTPKDPGSTLH